MSKCYREQWEVTWGLEDPHNERATTRRRRKWQIIFTNLKKKKRTRM